MSKQRVFALLGRSDTPTDAVEEYCRHLAESLSAHEIQMELRRVPWELHGWPHSLEALRLMAGPWRGTWVLAQYTALAWSARGFPLRFIQALRILARAGARIGIVFHDVEAYSGTRVIDRVRQLAQVRTMRRALDLADLAIFTVPMEKISWLPAASGKAAFLPVGPNLPLPFQRTVTATSKVTASIPAIAVFSITGGDAGARETREIVAAVRFAAEKLGKIRLCVFGRHAEIRKDALWDGLRDLPVELSVEGVLEGTQVVEKLSACDVLLFVRGPISSRRSSAIAGIACGLPVIGYSGSETAAPVTDAGVVLIPFVQDSASRQEQLNAALLRVLSDTAQRAELAARSSSEYEGHFCWSAIAARLAEMLSQYET